MYDLDDSEEDAVDAMPDFMKHEDPDPDAPDPAVEAAPDNGGEPEGGNEPDGSGNPERGDDKE